MNTVSRIVIAVCLSAFLSACQLLSSKDRLYEELGAQSGIEVMSESFVRRLIKDPRTEGAFKDTDLDRFYEKFVEQICSLSGGPCTYTGDDMTRVHQGMNIPESQFNAVVEILQSAMVDAEISLGAQNRLLAILAPMRAEMIYK